MTTLQLAGVPEHFNLPIHLAIEEGLFKKNNLDINWVEFADGTGAMNKALRTAEVDMAIILTDGLVKDIAAGNPSKIIQNYVKSPLIWGIHVGSKSSFETEEELEGARCAISRYGSGSHVMAYVHAGNMGWDTSKLKFVEVGTLEGAIEALTQGEADYFMWEHFTTKPIVDKGIFRHIADCPTPWSSFVIAAREDVITHHKDSLSAFLRVLNKVTTDFKFIPSIDKTIAHRYNQDLEDVRNWLSITEWSQKQIEKSEISQVQKRLNSLNIIENVHNTDFYLTDF